MRTAAFTSQVSFLSNVAFGVPRRAEYAILRRNRKPGITRYGTRTISLGTIRCCWMRN